MDRFLKYVLAMSLLFAFGVIGQSQHVPKSYYKEKLEPKSKLLQHGPTWTFEKTTEGKYLFKRYYFETKAITHLITYKSEAGRIMEGLYEEKWDDGTLVSKGNYLNNKKSGEWVSGNEIVTKGHYVDGEKHGEWISVKNDSLIRSKENFMNGVLDGVSYSYDFNGALATEFHYKDGELMKQIDHTDTKHAARKEGFEVVELMPMFPGCDSLQSDYKLQKKCAEKLMLNFIYSNVKYPRYAQRRNIEGKAMVRFVVDKDGSVTDVEVRRGVCNAIKQECMRITTTMPRWNPGMQKGKPVKVYFNLPIHFRLE